MFSTKLLPYVAFFAYLAKTIAFSPTIPDAIILCALVSYVILDNLTLKDKKIKEFQEEIKNFREVTEKLALDIRNLQSNISTVKIAQGMRPLIAPKQQSGT